MAADKTRDRSWRSRSAWLACTAAVPLTLFALLCSHAYTTKAADIEADIVALACSCLAIVLLLVAWPRISIVGHVFSVSVAVANFWALYVAGTHLAVVLGQ